MTQYSLPLNTVIDEQETSDEVILSFTKRQKQLINASAEIQSITAAEADEVGYGAKCLIAACLPYRNPKPEQLTNGCWSRTNGIYSLWVQGGAEGIPYGSYPRLFTIWLTTEAKITGSRHISLGRSFKAFCSTLNLDCSRGKNGAGRRLIEQMNRFLSSRISFTKIEKTKDNTYKAKREFIPFSDQYQLIWGQEHSSSDAILKEADIVLSEAFFKEITTYHIPIDLRAIRDLKQSSQALDIYQWLAYRNFQLNHSPKKKAYITWEQLNEQFGANYSNLRQFKAEFIKVLRYVQTVYVEAKVDIEQGKQGRLILSASPTPVSPIKLIR